MMKRLRLRLLLLLSLALLCPGLGAETAKLRAGAATSNITPPLGMAIIGGFRPFPATHVHDELHARCMVLESGETRIAFVVCDLLGAHSAVFDEARRMVGAETQIPATNVFISCTHTHSAASALGQDRMEPAPALDDYQRFVARRIADGVRRAENQLAPAKIGWGTGSEPREVFNRRWFMKPGPVPKNPFGETTDLVKMNPPVASKNLEKPAGPTDPEIVVLAARTPEGQPIGMLAVYSLHYVGDVKGADISADYYGMFCDRMQQLLGADRQSPPFVAMLANGTSGNINNIDFSKPAEKQAPYKKMRQVADNVAAATLAAYEKMEWRDEVSLAARFEPLEVALRHPTPEQLARAKSILANPSEGAALSLEEIYADRVKRVAESPATAPLNLQVIRVGDAIFGGVPGEVFVETGLAFKERAPSKPSCIISLNNGYFGYIPTPEQHKLGGYETWLGTSRLEVEASTKILDRLLEMARALK